jgi:hypothetical protein
MNDFQCVFAVAQTTAATARRLADLEYRYVRRYRLWDRPETEQQRRSIAKLSARRRDAIEAAEDADFQFNRLCDHYARAMPPISGRTDAEVGGDAQADEAVDALIGTGDIDDPENVLRYGGYDARCVLDYFLHWAMAERCP